MKNSIITVPVERRNAKAEPYREQDLLAVEEPLQIQLNGRDLAITMRTPGVDQELAAGFLFTEGILPSRDSLEGIDLTENGVNVRTRLDTEAEDLATQTRHFYLTSSCGVCGKASVDALLAAGCTAPPRDRPRISAATIRALPDILRAAQPVFDRTGGLHGAALFDPAGQLLLTREDVGRHNAVDKLIGRAVLDGMLPLNQAILLVSGRVSFELVQKALMAGIPILCSVGAPSSLAVETAMRFGMTLAGFVRDGRFNLYSGSDRVE